jgi:uncharacterized protein YndB with AHSA1/START domain
MSMTRIVNAVQINRPPADVFDYVTAPLNWPQWHPSSVSVDVNTGRSLRISEQVREVIVVGGRRDRVLWVVREYDRPHRWVIEGRGERGGTAIITYRLSPAGRGTAFERDLVYQVSGIVLRLLDVLFIRGRMRAGSRQALEQLKRVLESSNTSGIGSPA